MAITGGNAVQISERHLLELLEARACEEGLTAFERELLNLSAHTHYDVNSMSLMVAVRYGGRSGMEYRQRVAAVNENDIEDHTVRGIILSEITNFNLRNELYFLRLAKRLGGTKRLKEINRYHLLPDKVEVVFQNGQRLVIDEEKLEDDEFIAKCIMVYDI